MADGAPGDQIGRKRCFVVGLAIFTVTAILIGLPPSLLLLNLLTAAVCLFTLRRDENPADVKVEAGWKCDGVRTSGAAHWSGSRKIGTV